MSYNMMHHHDEIIFDAAFVGRNIAVQTPQWAGLSLRQVKHSGTDNAIFRLGDDLLVRLPRRPSAIACLEKELDWLPHLTDLPLATPTLRFRATTVAGPQLPFGIFNWMEGDIATPERIADWHAAALDIAAFLKALHLKGTLGAPLAGDGNHNRGAALYTALGHYAFGNRYIS